MTSGNTRAWSTWCIGTAAPSSCVRPSAGAAGASTVSRSSSAKARGAFRSGPVAALRWTSCAGPHAVAFNLPNFPHLRPASEEAAPTHEPAGLALAPPPPAPDGITHPGKRHAGPRFLTDVIVELGFVERDRADAAVHAARESATTPEEVLLGWGAITEDLLARAIAERNGLDHLDLTLFHVDMAAANLLSSAAAKRYDAVPVGFRGERSLVVAMADPTNVLAIDDIALMTGYDVRPAVASREDIDGIVAQAVEQGASDVHLSPSGDELRVRFRIDGVLQDSATVPRRMVSGVIS